MTLKSALPNIDKGGEGEIILERVFFHVYCHFILTGIVSENLDLEIF